jgi:hypothetical protein
MYPIDESDTNSDVPNEVSRMNKLVLDILVNIDLRISHCKG